MGTTAWIAAVRPARSQRRVDGVAGGGGTGAEHLPILVAGQRPARLAVTRYVGVKMHQSGDPAVSAIGGGRDHHPAVAVADQRRVGDVGAIEERQYVAGV